MLALLPVGLWGIFSWWQERFVPQPRLRLLPVLAISALIANAVGLPLVNDFLQVDRWLPLSSALMRIAGYTFTVGVVQEVLKYLVVYYTVWPNQFRIRLDGVAYGAASAIGYATVLNLHFVLSGTPPADVAAVRIFTTLALHLVTSAIVGYGLAEVRFSRPTPFLVATTIALAAFVTGVAIPVRAGLVNANLSLDVNGTQPFLNTSTARPLLGLGVSIALLIGLNLVLSFLFEGAERREREAASHEV
jgi:RsiW-degrading membrane proteinase PrsW (M82 family)